MQVDLLFDPFGARWAEVRDAAGVAIDAGFAGIWTLDHLDGRVYDAPFVLECWTGWSIWGSSCRPTARSSGS